MFIYLLAYLFKKICNRCLQSFRLYFYGEINYSTGLYLPLGSCPPAEGFPAALLQNLYQITGFCSVGFPCRLLSLGSGRSRPLRLHCCAARSDEWMQVFGLTDTFVNLVSGNSFARLCNRSVVNTCILISERLGLPVYLHWCPLCALVSAIKGVIRTSLSGFLSCSCLASCERKP